MSIKHRIFNAWVIIIALGLSGCIFVPYVSEVQPYSDSCDLITNELSLSSEVVMSTEECSGSTECLLAVIGVPAATFVVSGSIVLIGNTVHWLEYQGRCESSELSQQIESFKKSFESL